MAVAASRPAPRRAIGSAVAGGGARARRTHNLIPLRHDVHRRLRDAGLGVPEAARAGAGEPAFLLESAEQGQRVGRWSFIGFRPRAVLRWSLADGGDPYALAASSVGALRPGAARRTLPPFAGGAVGFFGYDLVRTVEPLGEPGPDPLGLPDMALMLSDALVVFDHLKHTVTILANADLQAEPDVERAYARGARARSREVRARARRTACRAAAAAPAARERCRVRVEHDRASTSRRSSRGSSSTSTPATPSRSCPRSAGRRRCRSRRSRSTAACARSTRARTCTSWTSATSRSPAPAPSRC